MSECYYNEFRPLAETPQGQAAIAQHTLPPFIDASCRREPDLQSAYPSITALCREGHFAPHLREGDLVVYMTKDFAYPPETASTRRLVAVLRVKKSWLEHTPHHGISLHEKAAGWYQQQGLPAPSNCMVDDNAPKPLNQTDRYKPDLGEWDRAYRFRAIECGAFHACESIFCDVNDPPQLSTQQLLGWFCKIPNPREMTPLPQAAFGKMLSWLEERTSLPPPKAGGAGGVEKSLLHQAFSGEL